MAKIVVEEKDVSLEENMLSLSELVKTLESEDISLEDSFKAYKAGMDLVKRCNEQIDQVEKQVLILREDGDTDTF